MLGILVHLVSFRSSIIRWCMYFSDDLVSSAGCRRQVDQLRLEYYLVLSGVALFSI